MASYPASSYPTPDGLSPSNRVASLTVRKLYNKVVDNILNSETYAARLFGMGESFVGSTFDIAVKVTNSNQGQWFTGIETLNSSASDTTITLSYAQTQMAYPQVSIMTESFANAGPTGVIPLDKFKYEEMKAEAVQYAGASVYSTGTGGQPDGLQAGVDDGSSVNLIGGQSRATYTQLKAKVTAFGSGILSLANLATLESGIMAAGLVSEEPNISLVGRSTFNLYEQLLTPTVRATYQAIGYDSVPVMGFGDETRSKILRRPELAGAAGLTAASYRGKPLIRDDQAETTVPTSWFMLNERYFGFKGRTEVPTQFTDVLKKIDFSEFVTYEGVGANEPMPPRTPGWFYQEPIMLPNQAGKVGRLFLVGQICWWQPRRNGVGTGITTV